MHDFFSDHSRRVRAELNARYNTCPNPWGYQEFGPRMQTINWRLILALLLTAAFWVGVHQAFEWLTRNDCDTDAQCAALPRCFLAENCDGGPDSEPLVFPWERW